MKNYFSFRTDRYDFWPVYDAIKKYYPLGVSKDYDSYFEYPGLKMLEKLIVDTIHQPSQFKESWKKLCDDYSTSHKIKVIDSTYGIAPSFSAIMEWDAGKFGDRVVAKELHFAISLLGPFYTVFGLDNTSLQDNETPYRHSHRIIISPFHEHKAHFNQIREEIEQAFPGYKFVPYFIHSSYIKGLEVRYRDEKSNTIYNALFNDLCTFKSPAVGEQFTYGFDQWLIDNPDFTDYWTV